MLKMHPSLPYVANHATAFVRRVVIAHLVVGLVALSPGVSRLPAALAQGTVPNARLTHLTDAFDRLADLRAAIDRTTFDVNALTLAFAFDDAETIVEWVRDAIAFEQYPGVLRGTGGTLMARAGNAYDQALLLATLLKDAGYDARIVEGVLDRSGAEALLAELGRPRTPAPAGLDVAAAAEAVAALGALAGFGTAGTADLVAALAAPAALGPEADALLLAVAADTERLLGLLGAAGVVIGDAALADDLVEEARVYAWVEYRPGAGDAWQVAQPAFGVGGEAPAPPSAQRTFEDAVPDDLLHRVRIESVLESRRGSSLVTTDLMTPWERPSPALVGTAITYMNVPGSLLTAPGALTDELLGGGGFFFPTLLEGFPPGAQAFDTLGLVVPADVALDPAAGVVRSTAAAGGRGATALGGLGGASPAAASVRFERQFLRFSLLAPGGRVTTFERVVARHDDDPVAVARSLAQRLTFMIDVGAVPPTYLLDRQLERLLALRPLVTALASGLLTAEDPLGDGSVLAGVATSWSGHGLVFEAFRSGAERPRAGLVSYRHAPALVAHGTVWTGPDTFEEWIDVISNPRRVLRTDGPRLLPDAAAMIEAGVWETHTEGLVLDTASATSPAINTMAAISAADAAGTALVVVTPDRAHEVDALGLAPDAASHLRRDLAAGYVVVVPSASTPDVPLGGWWRISLTDGETLGLTGDGRGQTMAERVAVQVGNLAIIVAVGCLVGILYERVDKSKFLTCAGVGLGGNAATFTIVCPQCAVVVGIVAMVIGMLDVFVVV